MINISHCRDVKIIKAFSLSASRVTVLEKFPQDAAMKTFTAILMFALTQTLSYGLSVPDRSGGRIVGGAEIPLSEAPYQVSLLYRGSHTCGG